MQSMRYIVFKHKGLTCVKCGREGTFFALERAKGQGQYGHYHFNLYSGKPEEGEVMMTRDHIIPRSKRGKDTLKNQQTMCGPCNWEKGNKMPP